MSESQNGEDCKEEHSTLRDRHVRTISECCGPRTRNFDSACIRGRGEDPCKN